MLIVSSLLVACGDQVPHFFIMKTLLPTMMVFLDVVVRLKSTTICPFSHGAYCSVISIAMPEEIVSPYDLLMVMASIYLNEYCKHLA